MWCQAIFVVVVSIYKEMANPKAFPRGRVLYFDETRYIHSTQPTVLENLEGHTDVRVQTLVVRLLTSIWVAHP